MDIKTMKNAARSAARRGSTSYQEELNRIARAAGFTHWGSLLAAQPQPSLGYRYNPHDVQNARDLQRARTDGVHVLYFASTWEMAAGHVLGMANSASLLPTAEQAQGRLIPRPPAIALVDEDPSYDWGVMPRVSCDGIADMPGGSVVYAERLLWRHVEAARNTGVTLIGGTTTEMDAGRDWPVDAEDFFLTLVVPDQDTGQLDRIYSREDQEIIHATTAMKYVLPRRNVPAAGLAQDQTGATTIRRRSDRPSTTRSNPNSIWADDYARLSKR